MGFSKKYSASMACSADHMFMVLKMSQLSIKSFAFSVNHKGFGSFNFKVSLTARG